MNYNKSTLLYLKKNEPEKFAKVLEEDCPCGWGFEIELGYCMDHDCEECWGEFLRETEDA